MYKNWLQKLLTVLGFVLFFFGLWQMDVISIPRIWAGGVADTPYEMGRIGPYRIVMSTGTGYDLMQACMMLGFIVAVLALWFWNE